MAGEDERNAVVRDFTQFQPVDLDVFARAFAQGGMGGVRVPVIEIGEAGVDREGAFAAEHAAKTADLDAAFAGKGGAALGGAFGFGMRDAGIDREHRTGQPLRFNQRTQSGKKFHWIRKRHPGERLRPGWCESYLDRQTTVSLTGLSFSCRDVRRTS